VKPARSVNITVMVSITATVPCGSRLAG